MVEVMSTVSKPSIILSERVQYMIQAAVNAEPNLEVGGLLKCEAESGVLAVTDILIPPQEVTSTHFDVGADSFVGWLTELAAKVANEQSKSVWEVYRGLWHSHCNMGTTPSSTDITQLHEWVNDEKLPWFIGLVANLKGEYTGWLQTGNPVPFRSLAEVFLSRTVNKELDAEVDAMMKHVKKQVFTVGKVPGVTKVSSASSSSKPRTKATTPSADSKRIGKALGHHLRIVGKAELDCFAEQAELSFADVNEEAKKKLLTEYASWLLDNIRGENKDDMQCLTATYLGVTTNSQEVFCLLPMGHTDMHWGLDQARDNVEWTIYEPNEGTGNADSEAALAALRNTSTQSRRCTMLVSHPTKKGSKLMCMRDNAHPGAHDPRRPTNTSIMTACGVVWCGLGTHTGDCKSEFEIMRDFGECGITLGGVNSTLKCNDVTGHEGGHSASMGEQMSLAQRVAAMDEGSTS